MVYGTYNELVFLGLLLTNVHITTGGLTLHKLLLHMGFCLTEVKGPNGCQGRETLTPLH